MYSLLLYGDTSYCENLIKYSKDADLLIHEVAAAPLGATISDNVRYILSLHTGPEECGRVFSVVKPKFALYNHILQCLGVSLEEMMDRTRKLYGGPVAFGEDL